MNVNRPLNSVAIPLPFTGAADVDKRHEVGDERMRIPFAHRIPDSLRGHIVAMSGEFVGTVLFLWFALGGTQVANTIHTSSGQMEAEVGSNPQQLQYIALCFGFSLAVNAWVFFRISGGLFNPAVTLGMCLIGALPWLRGILLFGTQIIAGMVAAALVSCMFPGPIATQTSLGGGTTIVQGLFIEMFLTAELIFTIFMLAAEKHKGTFIAPVGIGLSLFIAELVGVYFTGGSLNPARSFGPAVVNRRFHGYHWSIHTAPAACRSSSTDKSIVYWVGPILGAIVAAGFYRFIKVLEYETTNPEADSDRSAGANRSSELQATKTAGSHQSASSTLREGQNNINHNSAIAPEHHTNGLSNAADTEADRLNKKPWSTATENNDQVQRLGRGSSYMA